LALATRVTPGRREATGPSSVVHALPALLDLRADASCKVDSMQEWPSRFEREEFIDGLPGALPISVIIDDEDTVLSEQRIQAAQLVPGAFIPIRIQPYYCNLPRRSGWQRFENI